MTSWLMQRGSSSIVNPIILGWDGWGLFLIQYFLFRGFAPGKLFRPLPCGPSILVNMDHNYTLRPQPCGPFILVCMDHLRFLPLMLWIFYSSQVDHNHTLIFSTKIRSINSWHFTYIYFLWLSTWKIHREDQCVTRPQSDTLTQIKVNTFLPSLLYDFLINATGKFTYRKPHDPIAVSRSVGWGLVSPSRSPPWNFPFWCGNYI